MEVQMPSRMRRGNAVGGRRKPLSRSHQRSRPVLLAASSSAAAAAVFSAPHASIAARMLRLPMSPRIGGGGSGGGAQDRSSRSAALALAFSQSRSGSSSSAVGYGDIEVGKPCTVYRQRRTEAKRKCGVKEALQLPPSSSSVERTENIGKKLDKIRDGDGISKSGVTPSKRKQHPRLHKQDKPNSSLQDFTEQQRSYFAEIDAFELSEEEVAAAQASE